MHVQFNSIQFTVYKLDHDNSFIHSFINTLIVELNIEWIISGKKRHQIDAYVFANCIQLHINTYVHPQFQQQYHYEGLDGKLCECMSNSFLNESITDFTLFAYSAFKTHNCTITQENGQ